MNDRTRRRPGGARFRAGLLAALIFAVALNLRPAITSVGPLLPQLGEEFALTEGLQGLLGAVPLIALAVVSPLVHHPARRFGVDRAVLGALIGIVLGAVVRSYGGGVGLWVGTALIGCAIAIGNVLVPTIVRRDYPRHVARATGFYSACIVIGSAVASGVAFPMSRSVGWDGSLAFWAIPAAVVTVLWLPRARAGGRDVEKHAGGTGRTVSVWRQPTAWLVTAFMGLQSTHFFVIATWLPTMALASGSSPETAGLLLSVFQVASLVGVLTAPRLVLGTNVLPAAVTASVSMLVGLLGLLLLPAWTLVWVVIAGGGSGAALTIGLTLIGLRGRGHHETTQLSGMAQSVGYLFAALGPIGAGVFAEITGSWTAGLMMLAAMATAQLLVAFAVGKDRRPTG